MSRPVQIHRLALCESDEIGEGTRIWAFAHVLPGAILGADCNLGDHTFVEGGARLGDRVTLKNGVSVWDRVVLGDDVFVGPNAVFTNDHLPRSAPHRTPRSAHRTTVVESSATIGANATLVCGVTVGSHAFVGAGAVVTSDVPAHALVVGVPARRIAWVCACGERLGSSLSLECSCGRRYRLVDDSVGLELAGGDSDTTPTPTPPCQAGPDRR